MRIDAGLKLEAIYEGQDKHGNHILSDVKGDMKRSHAYLNGSHANFPEGIKTGSRIKFFACLFPRMGGARLSDCREVQVISE